MRAHLCSRIATSLVALSLACFVAACGSTSEPAPDSGPGPGVDSGPTSEPDAGSVGEVDAGLDAGSEDDGGTPPVGDFATLSGVVRRSTEPSAGGVGNLYVGLFDRDPVTMRDSAMTVASAVIADADMRSDGAAIPYTLSNIPPRAEPYYIVAFLDDNGTVTAASPGPDRGDLVTLNGFASPQVTLDTATSTTLDLDLNVALPF